MSSDMSRLLTVLLFATVTTATACTSTPSGATCPDNQADVPTYDSFGREFMETYCTGCHSAQSPDRHGAQGRRGVNGARPAQGRC